jgi:hypothetical protein
MAGPGTSALAKALAHNTALKSLSLFWVDMDSSALQELARCLSSNGTLTSLSLGDPAILGDEEAAAGYALILQHASPSLSRLSIAYVPFPSLEAAQTFCNALAAATTVQQLALPYLGARSEGLHNQRSAEPVSASQLQQAVPPMLSVALAARAPTLRALEVPCMSLWADADAHRAVLAAALSGASQLRELDMLQVRVPCCVHGAGACKLPHACRGCMHVAACRMAKALRCCRGPAEACAASGGQHSSTRTLSGCGAGLVRERMVCAGEPRQRGLGSCGRYAQCAAKPGAPAHVACGAEPHGRLRGGRHGRG